MATGVGQDRPLDSKTHCFSFSSQVMVYSLTMTKVEKTWSRQTDVSPGSAAQRPGWAKDHKAP